MGHRTYGGDDGGPGGAAGPVLSNATPLAIGPALAGTANTASRSDHRHPWLHVANQAALDALSAATMLDGQRVWVDTYKDSFTLTASTQAVAANVRRTALGKAGYLWIRDGFSPGWWNQTAWAINVTTGSDEAVGSVAAPLATAAEFRRRMFERWLPGTETQNVTLALQTDLADSDYVSMWQAMPRRNASNQLTVNGTQTVQVGGTGVISVAVAINRATNVRNTITVPGVNFAPFVGLLLRLQGTTTTTAVIMRDLGANTCELSEQSVNGATGTGFTAGQTIEVIKGTKIGGANLGPSNNFSTFNDIDFDPVGSAQVVNEASANTALSLNRCRFHGTGTVQLVAASLSLTACSFHDRAALVKGRASFIVCAQVNQSGEGTSITGAYDGTNENTAISHMCEASTITLRDDVYFHISGSGSASIGFFNLAAAQLGVNVTQGSLYSCGGTWGSGNNAASVMVQLQQGAGWVVPSFGVMATVMTVAGSAGLSIATQSAIVYVPMVSLPHAIGPGIQPASSNHFTAAVATAEGAAFTWSACSDVPAINNAIRFGFPTSEKLALRLRVRLADGALTLDATATVYKNGVATGMTVTIPAGSAVGTKFVDSTHATLFVEGDDYDVRVDAAGGSTDILVSAQIEWAG